MLNQIKYATFFNEIVDAEINLMLMWKPEWEPYLTLFSYQRQTNKIRFDYNKSYESCLQAAASFLFLVVVIIKLLASSSSLPLFLVAKENCRNTCNTNYIDAKEVFEISWNFFFFAQNERANEPSSDANELNKHERWISVFQRETNNKDASWKLLYYISFS